MRKLLYFIFAHLPYRLGLNVILYLGLASLSLQALSLYIDRNPQDVQRHLNQLLSIEIDYNQLETNFSLLNLDFELDDIQIKLKNNQLVNIKALDLQINLWQSILLLRPQISHLYIDQPKFDKDIFSFNFGENNSAPNNLSIQNVPNQDMGKLLKQLPKDIFEISKLRIDDAQISNLSKLNKFHGLEVNHFNIWIENTDWLHRIRFETNIYSLNTEQKQSPIPLVLYSEMNGNIDSFSHWAGKIYFSVNDLPYHLLEKTIDHSIESQLFETDFQINKATADLSVWANFDNNDINQILGQIKLSDISISNFKTTEDLNFNKIESNFTLFSSASLIKTKKNSNSQESRQQIHLSQTSLSPIGSDTFYIPKLSFQFDQFPDLTKTTIYSPYINTMGLNQLILFLLPDARNLIETIQPSAKLIDFTVNTNFKKSLLVDINTFFQLQHYQQALSSRYPEINNLSAKVWINNLGSDNTTNPFDHLKGAVKLDSADIRFDFNSFFKQAIELEKLNGVVTLKKNQNQWLLQMDQIFLKNPDLQFWLNGLVVADDLFQNPITELYGQFENVQLSSVPRYLPLPIMDKELIKWLNPAFDKGTASYGNLLFRGNLNNFPFEKQEGLLDIVFDIDNASLNYEAGWPIINDIEAQLQFTETGFRVQGEKARVFNTRTKDIIVHLNDYMKSSVVIDSQFNSSLKDAVKFMEQAKLVPTQSLHHLKTDFEQTAPITLDLKLDIPTDNKPIESWVNASFEKGLYIPKWLKHSNINGIKGGLSLYNDQITKLELSGNIDQQVLNLSLIQSKYAEDNYFYHLKSALNIDLLKQLTFLPEELSSVWDELSGITEIDATLKLAAGKHGTDKHSTEKHGTDKHSTEKHGTDKHGTEKHGIDKHGTELPRWSLNLQSDLLGINSNLPYPLHKKPEQNKNIIIDIEQLPSSEKINIKYNNKINWCLLETPDDVTQHFYMSLQQQNFTPDKCISKNVDYSFTGYWYLHNLVSWSDIIKPLFNNTGNTKFDFTNIALNLDSLHLAKPNAKKNIWDKKNETQASSVSPHQVLINGEVKNLFIGKKNYGLLTINAKPEQQNNITEKLTLKGDVINASINHSITNQGEQTFTESDIDLSLSDSGDFLQNIQLYKNLSGAPLNLKGNLQWPGSPWDFKLTKTQGQLTLDMQPGSLNNVDPGAAKILGVLNLNAFRQSLDKKYNKVEQNGLVFDTIVGELLFNKEILSTDNFKISSGIADIQAIGTVNLLDLGLDNILTITPKVSSSLTYVGLLLGGPTGAAVGWLGKQVFGKQLNKFNQFQYKVDGNIDEPIITEIIQK